MRDVRVEAQAGPRFGQDGGECHLAHLKRIAAQVGAVQLDQIEGVEEDIAIMPPVADSVELGMPRSSQATASPSMMQERERSRARASTIIGKRSVKSLPADCTASPVRRPCGRSPGSRRA